MSSIDSDILTRLEERLMDLEIRTTHQEATLETLNDVLVQQQQLISKLDNELKQARKRLSELGTSPDAQTQIEPPPPHY